MSNEKSVLDVLTEPRSLFSCSNMKEVDGSDVVKHQLIGLYFSASWCPPCRDFTQILSEAYKQIRSTHGQDSFEVVLVPLDKERLEWLEYIKGMPWLTFHKTNCQESIVRLFLRFTINKIPRLVIIDGQGEVVCDNARGEQTFGFGMDPLVGYSYLRDLQRAVEQNRARLAERTGTVRVTVKQPPKESSSTTKRSNSKPRRVSMAPNAK